MKAGEKRKKDKKPRTPTCVLYNIGALVFLSCLYISFSLNLYLFLPFLSYIFEKKGENMGRAVIMFFFFTLALLSYRVQVLTSPDPSG